MAMIPEYKRGKWYAVETSVGTEYIPEDLLDEITNKENAVALEDLEEFLEGEPKKREGEDDFEFIKGWGVRIKAPGFDISEWFVFDTKEEAEEHAEIYMESDESDIVSGYMDYPDENDDYNKRNNDEDSSLWD